MLAVGGCRGAPSPRPGDRRPLKRGDVQITWYGQSMFHIADASQEIVSDPYGPEIGYIVPRVSADVVLLSGGAYGARAAARVRGRPRVVDGIGESYVGGLAIAGIPSVRKGAGKGSNRIYYWKMQGISLAHMGDLGQQRLSDQQEGLLRHVDVLMIPVGGRATADARTSAKIARKIGARVVIPMDFKTEAAVVDLAPVEVFSARFAVIRRVGESVRFSRAELPSQTEVWVMKYQRQRP